jgi:poly-gamma-glutamate capsule biosynthesis protein CapA/YwtB (metallophosphatase superfamily)
MYKLVITFLLLAEVVCAQDSARLRLLFVGDIMQHDTNIQSAYNKQTGRYDYSSCFRYIKPHIQSADVAFGNLELTLAGPPFKGYPQFSAPDELAFELKRTGFDVLVTANNHSVDRGKRGLVRTLDVLDSAGLIHTGTFRTAEERDQSYPLLIERDGWLLAILNYTYGTNGIPVPAGTVVNLLDSAQMKKDFARARALKPDAILVFPHWGIENVRVPNAEQKKWATFFFRQGATLVLGSHPHMLQGVEFSAERQQLVAWSLGNFVSNMRKRYQDGAMLLNLDLVKKSGRVTIERPRYQLAWMLANAPDSIALVPAEVGDTLMTRVSNAREPYRIFMDDSRAHLMKENKNVPEGMPRYTYRILLMENSDELSLKWPEIIRFYGVYKSVDLKGNINWYAGEFEDLEIAQAVLVEIRSKTSFSNARLEAFVL